MQKYGLNYTVTSDNNDRLMKLFYDVCDKNRIVRGNDALFEYMRTFDENRRGQMELF